ncbi:type II toxin-antitoxin system HicA family toxin [Nocardiopsis algeriensis]|uniref:type II toxin-antitoxin system HicA family toxin n=1 Tax=Nocardiopsis algeriensis TaxID=1478215 RepID=UPI003B438D66
MSPSHIPVTSGSKLVRALERVGWEHVSTKGDHAKLRKGGVRVIVPLHKELKRGTTAAILRQIGMSPEALRDLL